MENTFTSHIKQLGMQAFEESTGSAFFTLR